MAGDHQKQARVRFDRITDAYEAIKNQRGDQVRIHHHYALNGPIECK